MIWQGRSDLKYHTHEKEKYMHSGIHMKAAKDKTNRNCNKTE
jgi:hypothetical protein